MIIIGNGLVARAFFNFQKDCKDSLIFASGVSNSRLTDESEFLRERCLLEENILRCKREKLRLVYFSSAGEVYGSTDRPAKETDLLTPQTLYGIKKVEFEELIRNSGINYLVLRLSNIVGRNQSEHQLFPSLVKQVLRGRITVYRDAQRDLVDVEDLSRGVVRLLKLGLNREILNFVSGISVPISEIVSFIISWAQLECYIDYLSGGEKHWFSNEKLSTILPWVETYFDREYYKRVLNKYLKFYLKR